MITQQYPGRRFSSFMIYDCPVPVLLFFSVKGHDATYYLTFPLPPSAIHRMTACISCFLSSWQWNTVTVNIFFGEFTVRAEHVLTLRDKQYHCDAQYMWTTELSFNNVCNNNQMSIENSSAVMLVISRRKLEEKPSTISMQFK